MSKPQLHVSAINMLGFCGEQFRRRYIEKEKVPPGIAAVVGKATDRTVTRDLESKKNTGDLLQSEEVIDLAATLFKEEVEGDEGLRTLPEEIATAGSMEALIGKAKDKAIRLSFAHHKGLAPSITPTHLQRAFTLNLTGFPVDIAGTIDIQSLELPVRDTKTAGKTPAAGVAEESDQLTVYAMAVHVLDQEPLPIRVGLDYLVDLKMPTAKTFSSSRGKEDFGPFLRRVETSVKAIQAGIFVPVKQNDPLCSPKYCGFHSTCPYVRRPVSVAVGS